MDILTEGLGEGENWPLLCQFLPAGWEEQARRSGALTRARGIAGAESLLRILLIHLANGHSLVETALRAREAGWGQMSAVALFKRLRASEQWLRWLAEGMRAARGWQPPRGARRVRAVDATTVSEPGSTGTDWRIHYALNLRDLQCDFFELTDVRGGETWRRVPVAKGDLLLGDRVYGTPSGIGHVVGARGDVIVRISLHNLPLLDSRGRRLEVLPLLRGLKLPQVGEWPAAIQPPQGEKVPGRLLAVKRNAVATRLIQQRMRRKARRQQRALSKEVWEAAAYFLLWTSLSPRWTAHEVLDLYRVRWQIELAFKRLKSLMGLGHLPKKDPASARAWLHGKLFVSLLAEQMIATANAISPWGYNLEAAEKSLAGNGIHVS
jgi:hypothetical protein